MAAKQEDKWKDFCAKMKNKRTSRCATKKVQSKGKQMELTVQRLSADVGKAQKYSKLGPREFVAFVNEDTGEAQELTIENIKTACEKHFTATVYQNKICDVLAGERGPSCKSIGQLPDLKVIHVRFIDTSEDYLECPRESVESGKRQLHVSDHNAQNTSKIRCCSSITSKDARSCFSSASSNNSDNFVPRSLSVSEMIKLGKLRDKKVTPTIIKMHTFDLDIPSWSSVTETVEFYMENTPIGSGGFRSAYRASSKHSKFNSCKWVIKYYHPEAIKGIQETGQTVEDHTKKVVQMHLLTRNLAAKLTQKVHNEGLSSSFGHTLSYRNIFWGEVQQDGVAVNVTVEEFVPGNFKKYLNNTGIVCGEESELSQKAECLSHFSYQESQQKLLIVDIQGSEYNCFDPEIASTELFDNDEIMYCAGNLSTIAITNFFEQHRCNVFCSLLGLQEVTKLHV